MTAQEQAKAIVLDWQQSTFVTFISGYCEEYLINKIAEIIQMFRDERDNLSEQVKTRNEYIRTLEARAEGVHSDEKS